MRIENYFRWIQKIMDSCSGVQSSTIMFDKRSTYEGYIRGDIFFVDDSTLHFREFIDVETDEERLMYVYQYRSSSKMLIFRYDNTGHHRKLGLSSYPHHKHEGRESNVIPATAMDLASVIEEIESMVQRNALAGAQLEFKTTLNYKDQGKPSAEILKESATNLLRNISLIHEKYNISKEETSTLLLPDLKTIAEIADHLKDVISDVSSDLNRGLSITTQIRDYAKMSEIKPGDEVVDIGFLLRSYQDRYRQDFDRIGINYTVEGPEAAVVKADETHINSIFSNLILNAKDALEEIESGQAKEITVTVEKRETLFHNCCR